MAKKVCATVYAVAWLTSIVLGFIFLFAPLLPLIFISRKLFRRATDCLFALWESFNVSLIDVLLGPRICITGDKFDVSSRSGGKSSLILLNHRTRLDWNFLWSLLFHNSVPNGGHNAKLVLKSDIRTIPGVGWTMQFSRFLYIVRNWKQDEAILGKMVDYLNKDLDHECQGYQVVLFPEGTNLTPDTKAKSDAFASENNLPSYKHLLHPRTTGFSCLVEKMRASSNFDAIYDVTVAYEGEMPKDERALFDGAVPEEIHFHVKRYPSQSVPTTIVGLEKWLQELWREKEQMLEKFHCGTDCEPASKSFQATMPGSNDSRCRARPQQVLPLQMLSLVAWTYFIYYVVAHVLFSFYGFAWALLVAGVMFLASKYTQGIQEIEVTLERFGSFPGLLQVASSLVGLRRSNEKSE